MMNNISKDEMKVLELDDLSDEVVKDIPKSINVKEIHKSLYNDEHHLIFPICGKRCYNVVTYIKTKKDTNNKDSEYAVLKSWDKDGSDNKRSSIDVLIDWLTTQENASSYFGGIDVDGRTNSNRKETYHLVIRDVIRNENGKCV